MKRANTRKGTSCIRSKEKLYFRSDDAWRDIQVLQSKVEVAVAVRTRPGEIAQGFVMMGCRATDPVVGWRDTGRFLPPSIATLGYMVDELKKMLSGEESWKVHPSARPSAYVWALQQGAPQLAELSSLWQKCLAIPHRKCLYCFKRKAKRCHCKKETQQETRQAQKHIRERPEGFKIRPTVPGAGKKLDNMTARVADLVCNYDAKLSGRWEVDRMVHLKPYERHYPLFGHKLELGFLASDLGINVDAVKRKLAKDHKGHGRLSFWTTGSWRDIGIQHFPLAVVVTVHLNLVQIARAIVIVGGHERALDGTWKHTYQVPPDIATLGCLVDMSEDVLNAGGFGCSMARSAYSLCLHQGMERMQTLSSYWQDHKANAVRIWREHSKLEKQERLQRAEQT